MSTVALNALKVAAANARRAGCTDNQILATVAPDRLAALVGAVEAVTTEMNKFLTARGAAPKPTLPPAPKPLFRPATQSDQYPKRTGKAPAGLFHGAQNGRGNGGRST